MVIKTAAGFLLFGEDASTAKSRTRRKIVCSSNALSWHWLLSQFEILRKVVLSETSLGGITRLKARSNSSALSFKVVAPSRSIPSAFIMLRNFLSSIAV